MRKECVKVSPTNIYSYAVSPGDTIIAINGTPVSDAKDLFDERERCPVIAFFLIKKNVQSNEITLLVKRPFGHYSRPSLLPERVRFCLFAF